MLKNRKVYNIIIFGLLFSMAVFMIMFSQKQSLWYDEIYQIAYIRKGLSLSEILNYYATFEITNLPFYPLILAVWYRIAPHGEGWLLLISEVSVLIGIYFIGKTSRELQGEEAGIIATILSVFSSTLILSCGYEVRAYAFLFLFSSLSIYLYVQENMDKNIYKIVLYGMSLCALLYSHYFGALTVFVIGCFDLKNVFMKNKNHKILFSYIIAAVFFFPWFLYAMIHRTRSISDFWPSVPKWTSLGDTLKYLLSDNVLLYAALLIYIAYIISKRIILKKKSQYCMDMDVLLVVLILFPLIIIYIYSAFINSRGSLYVNRYFITIFPAMIILFSLFIVSLVNIIQKQYRNEIMISLIILFVAVYGIPNLNKVISDVTQVNDPYREVAQYLSKQDNLDNGRTAIYNNADFIEIQGYRQYYFDYYGVDANAKILTKSEFRDSSNIAQFDKIYVFETLTIAEEDELYLEENFELIENQEEIHLKLFVRKDEE